MYYGFFIFDYIKPYDIVVFIIAIISYMIFYVYGKKIYEMKPKEPSKLLTIVTGISLIALVISVVYIIIRMGYWFILMIGGLIHK